MAGGHGGAREGSGRGHLAQKSDNQAVSPINGARARVDQIIADERPLPAEIMVEAARYDLERARRHGERAAKAVEAGQIDEAERLEAGTSKLYGLAAATAAKAAPYFHPKLASVEHTGSGQAPVMQGGVNITVLNLFGSLAESRDKSKAVIEDAKIINPDGTPFQLPGEGAVQLEDIASDVVQRMREGAARLGLQAPEKPEGT